MFEIISLDQNEGVASVADKIISCRSHQVYLLLSKENDLFNDLFSLKLIKREAEKNDKELILIIPENKEGLDLDLIKKARIKMIFENELENFVSKIREDEKEEKKEKSSHRSIFDSGSTWADNEEENDDMTDYSNKRSQYSDGSNGSSTESAGTGRANIFTPNKKVRLFRSSRNFLISWGILSLLILGLVIYLFLGLATVEIFPHQDKFTFQKSIIASQNIHQLMVSSNQIPAKVITLSKIQKKDFPATGIKTIKEKAKGEIIIYNQFSSRPQRLVATTRFRTSDGKIFRLVKSIIVPGAKVENGKIVANSIKATVVADRAGSDYNIGPTSFTIPGFKGSPKYKGFYAQSKQPMTGGKISDAEIVTNNDLSRAKNIMKKSFNNNSQEMAQELLKKIPAEYKILNNKINYTRGKITCSARVGATTNSFFCQEYQKVEAIVFKESDLISLAKMGNYDFFKNKIIDLSQSEFNYSLINYDFADNQVSFKVDAKIIARDKVDQQQLKNDLIGKNRDEVKDLISQKYPNIAQIKISFWPIWVKKIPQNVNRIKIKVK